MEGGKKSDDDGPGGDCLVSREEVVRTDVEGTVRWRAYFGIVLDMNPGIRLPSCYGAEVVESRE